jgi:tetratricopeptide (TPR) repeat protein
LDTEPTTQPGGGRIVAGSARSTARPSAPPLAEPSFSNSSSSAEELAGAGRFEEAIREYEATLATSEASEQRVGLLAGLSRVLAKLGRTEQAAQRFSEASELDPAHPDVLCVRAEWAEAALDFQNVLQTVEHWIAVRPTDPRPLTFFARAAEALGDAAKACDTWARLGSNPQLAPRARAEAFFQASRLAESQLDDRTASEDFAGQAMVFAPWEAALRKRASELFANGSRPEALFAYFEQALATVQDAETLAQLVEEVQIYSRAQGQPARGARCLEPALAKHSADLPLRDRLMELYAAAKTPNEALVHCRVAARLAPTRAGTYRRAHALFHAAGVTDGAWNAASVLESLGEADINEALFASQHKPEGLLAARSMLDDAHWPSGLLSEVRDAELEAVVSALEAAAVRVGIGLLKQKKRFIEFDPASKEDPDRSTTMLAKTLGWTSRLLGLAPPALYILPELESHIEVAPSEEPGTLVSRALGSGLGLGQLAFLWGRHLSRFRSELRALSFFRRPDELASLLQAALALGGDAEIDVRTLEGDAKRLYAALRREVRGSALESLQSATRRLRARDIDRRSRSALRGLELAGVRAGLLSCGDVGVAAELLRRFPDAGLTDTEEQLGELYAFSISEQYQALRLRIGVAVA